MDALKTARQQHDYWKTNAIIAIDNSDDFEADTIGINALIVDNTFSQGNRALTAITNTLSVPTDSFTQSAKVRQSNTINAEIAINNSGHLDADIIGINAVIADNAVGQTKLAEELAGQPTTSLLKQRLRPGKPMELLRKRLARKRPKPGASASAQMNGKTSRITYPSQINSSAPKT